MDKTEVPGESSDDRELTKSDFSDRDEGGDGERLDGADERDLRVRRRRASDRRQTNEQGRKAMAASLRHGGARRRTKSAAKRRKRQGELSDGELGLRLLRARCRAPDVLGLSVAAVDVKNGRSAGPYVGNPEKRGIGRRCFHRTESVWATGGHLTCRRTKGRLTCLPSTGRLVLSATQLPTGSYG